MSACPECLQGKHQNCDGTTWDVVADDFAPCPCQRNNHGHGGVLAATLTSNERAAYQSMVARGVPPDVAVEEALDGITVDEVRHNALVGVAYPDIPVRAAEEGALGTAVLGEVPQCNGHCNHDGADRDCLIHGETADRRDQQWCTTCSAWCDVAEVFDEQIGFEEQARPVVVTALTCGHQIVRKGRWNP